MNDGDLIAESVYHNSVEHVNGRVLIIVFLIFYSWLHIQSWAAVNCLGILYQHFFFEIFILRVRSEKRIFLGHQIRHAWRHIIGTLGLRDIKAHVWLMHLYIHEASTEHLRWWIDSPWVDKLPYIIW